AIVSSGTLLAALGYGGTALVGDALFYLLSSTLGVAALLLLVELVERLRNPAAAMLAVIVDAFAVEDAPGDAVGVIIPAALAFLGLGYIVGALIVTGMPPLSGFVAKFGLLHGLLGAVDGAGPSIGGWLLLTLLVASGLLGIIALMRFG